MSSSERGFTLIEVLVALSIVAIALAASIRATGTLAGNDAALQGRLLALSAAQNQLERLRIERAFPEPGTQTLPCPQGPLALVCEQQVSRTVDTAFRQVTIRVHPEHDRTQTLVRLDGILTRRR